MLIGLAAGFAVNANLKELYQGNGDAVGLGITAVSLFALANAAGRVIWGALFDRIRSATAIQANLLCQALVLGIAPFVLDSAMGFLTVAVLAGFNYGGVLVIYVSSASRSWGLANVGQVYGWLFSSNIPASLSPIVAGMVYDRMNNFDLVLYITAALMVVGSLVVRRNTEVVNSTKSQHA
jgi:OFA family oxalate/formate antiporter-like MFS transporter